MAIAIATLFDFVRVVNKFIDQHGLEAKKPATELATLDAMLLVMRELTEAGVVLEDRPDGTGWSRK